MKFHHLSLSAFLAIVGSSNAFLTSSTNHVVTTGAACEKKVRPFGMANLPKMSNDTNDMELTKAPSFNGKLVMPMKIMTTGLRGHKVAAVYAVLNKQYKRGYVPHYPYESTSKLINHFHSLLFLALSY